MRERAELARAPDRGQAAGLQIAGILPSATARLASVRAAASDSVPRAFYCGVRILFYMLRNEDNTTSCLQDFCGEGPIFALFGRESFLISVTCAGGQIANRNGAG